MFFSPVYLFSRFDFRQILLRCLSSSKARDSRSFTKLFYPGLAIPDRLPLEISQVSFFGMSNIIVAQLMFRCLMRFCRQRFQNGSSCGFPTANDVELFEERRGEDRRKDSAFHRTAARLVGLVRNTSSTG